MAPAWIVEPPSPPAEKPRGLRVLVVEDQPDCATSMALLLRSNGHDVRVAADGPTAVREAQTLPPDVVLLDIA
jgi:two-component system CheB/CheR fusion protein